MAKTEAKRDPAKEYPDPTPVEIPIEMQRPETMDEKIKRIIQTTISEKAMMLGQESLEEANDFDVQDEFEVDNPVSKHEVFEMQEEFPVNEYDDGNKSDEGGASPLLSDDIKNSPEAKSVPADDESPSSSDGTQQD